MKTPLPTAPSRKLYTDPANGCQTHQPPIPHSKLPVTPKSADGPIHAPKHFSIPPVAVLRHVLAMHAASCAAHKLYALFLTVASYDAWEGHAPTLKINNKLAEVIDVVPALLWEAVFELEKYEVVTRLQPSIYYLECGLQPSPTLDAVSEDVENVYKSALDTATVRRW